jgi:hypothetical protein
MRTCSYLDQKRGMRGSEATGPMTLRFTDLWHCRILIGEPVKVTT